MEVDSAAVDRVLDVVVRVFARDERPVEFGHVHGGHDLCFGAVGVFQQCSDGSPNAGPEDALDAVPEALPEGPPASGVGRGAVVVRLDVLCVSPDLDALICLFVYSEATTEGAFDEFVCCVVDVCVLSLRNCRCYVVFLDEVSRH